MILLNMIIIMDGDYNIIAIIMIISPLVISTSVEETL